MKRRDLEPRLDKEQSTVSVIFEFKAMVSGKTQNLEEVFESFQKSIQSFYDSCDEKNVSVVKGEGRARPLTKEESLVLVPRKWHMSQSNGVHLCDVPHVKKSYITSNSSKVTCKLCLKKDEAMNCIFISWKDMS